MRKSNVPPIAPQEISEGFVRNCCLQYGTLTTQEKNVAKLSALGHSTAIIGVKLHIAKKTVDTHLDNIKAKFRVSQRKALSLCVLAGLELIRPCFI